MRDISFSTPDNITWKPSEGLGDNWVRGNGEQIARETRETWEESEVKEVTTQLEEGGKVENDDNF